MNSILYFLKWATINILWTLLIVFTILSVRSAWHVYKTQESETAAREKKIFEKNHEIGKVKKDLEDHNVKLKRKAENIQRLKMEADRLSFLKHPFDKSKKYSGIFKENYESFEIHGEIFRIVQKRISLEGERVGLLAGKKQLESHRFLNTLMENIKSYGLRLVIWTAFFMFFSPLLTALFMYYCIAAYVEKLQPLKGRETEGNLKSAELFEADAKIDYFLHGQERLFLRAGWCKMRQNVTAKTKLMWNWHYPFVSIAADLFELIVFSAGEGKTGKITVTAPFEDMFVAKIELNKSRAIVIRPKYLVGVTEGVRIRTKWNFSTHNLLSGRMRQIILYGEGTILVAGSWGVEQTLPADKNDSRIEFDMLLGYDYHSSYSLCRTETFWHYFRNRARLYDIRIQHGRFFTQNNAWSKANQPQNTLERIFDTLLNLAGDWLGGI